MHCASHCALIPLALRGRLRLQPGARLMVVAFNGGLRFMHERPASKLRGIARFIDTKVKREPDHPLRAPH